jgi:LysM repeat protein
MNGMHTQSLLAIVLFFLLLLLQGCSTHYTSSPVSPAEQAFDSYYGSPANGITADNNASLVNGRKGGGLREDAPKRYVVKKGDTLWGISQKFLKTPTYWPEIWDKNQKVKNPHRIFPGDVLYLYYRKGSGTTNDQLVPTIRVERHGSGLPISTLEPLLMWPLIVDKDALSQAPYIVASRDDKLLIEGENSVYIKGLANSNRGDVYGVYQTGEELHDPETNELLGTEIKYHGKVSIMRPDRITTAFTEQVKREIKPADRLIKISEYRTALTAPMKAPTIKVRGVVMGLYDATLLSGQHMIALVNRGKRDGLHEGHIIGIYSNPKVVDDPYEKSTNKFKVVSAVPVTLPPERVGTMILYSVTDKVSYGLITESYNAVKKGYKIGNP